MPSPARTICVFCGSSTGLDPIYMDYARELGRAFLAHDFALVYGGGALGLMGALASTVHEGGGKVTGVIPDVMLAEVQGITIGETEVVRDLQERKARFNQLVCVRVFRFAVWCDAYIALPGGYGTMDELFEVIYLSQNGTHAKPILVMDIKGYFRPFFDWIELSAREGFIREQLRFIVRSCASVDEAIVALREYVSPTVLRRLQVEKEGAAEKEAEAEAEVKENVE
ncbi:hypothetical protein BC937DRAFT_87909 [Endogone sp. FLAS-F59071]|nr:hypothetical protein BC937DRAFT_87909 [Endogone sp. FLAS-F59071]|eukprot:RUS19164.1 hypothetical protein BC937DRAFT_87909 [Endogone sp. FLAS-F59071]